MNPDPGLTSPWRPVLAAAATMLTAHPDQSGDNAVLAALGWLIRTRAEPAAFAAAAKALRRHSGGTIAHA